MGNKDGKVVCKKKTEKYGFTFQTGLICKKKFYIPNRHSSNVCSTLLVEIFPVDEKNVKN